MIVLFTDFGVGDPYVGQVHAVLACEAPGVCVVDLFHGLPNYDIRAAAYLLPAYSAIFDPDTVFLCVVDPGVGGERRPVLVHADGRWYVGPDNGLFHVLARRARTCEVREIKWRPAQLSASFHGRDLFAPVAAMLARGNTPSAARVTLSPPSGAEWPDDLAQVVYIDHYGNAITGLRASVVDKAQPLRIKQHSLPYARVFADVPVGQAFWYENANGLAELAVNRGSAAEVLGLKCGDSVEVS